MCNLSDGIYERGLERGLERGEEQKLIELMCKKVNKGKNLETIAEELEEDAMSLLPIYNAVLKEAPDYNVDKIYETLHGVMLCK